jgi:hypothetical protein
MEGIFVGISGGRWSSRRGGAICLMTMSSGREIMVSAGAESGLRKTAGVAAQSWANETRTAPVASWGLRMARGI